MLILCSHHTKKNDYNQLQVQIFAIITPIFTKKLSLAFNSCRLFEIAQRHDGFRAMPSAAFLCVAKRQADKERVLHCRRPHRHGLERAKHRVKDRQCRWRHGSRYTRTVFSVTPCSLRPLQHCLFTGCATSADYGNTRHGLP